MKKTITYFLASMMLLVAFSAQSQILSEDFEAGFPDTWTYINSGAGDGFVHGTDATFNSQYYGVEAHTQFMGVNDDAAGNDVNQTDEGIMTPVFNVPMEGVTVVSFAYSFSDSDYQGVDETAKVFITTDVGVSTTELVNLEATTDNPIVGAWGMGNINISDYAGQDVQVIFHYADGSTWNYGVAFDDVTIDNLSGVEASMSTVNNAPFVEAGTEAVVFTVSNTAAENITSFTADFDVNGTVFTETFDAVSIPFGATVEFTSTGTFDVVGGDFNEIMVTLTDVNGSTDNVGAVNMAEGEVSGVLYWADRTVLLEEATGTWCQWCPRGAVFMDVMAADYPETSFGVAVHNGDPMVVTEYDAGIGPHIGGYPSGLVDRPGYETDPGDFPTEYATAVARPAVVDFDGSQAQYNTVTGELTIDASIKFTASTNREYTVAAVVTENGVTGTGAAWDQVNVYSGGGFGAMGGYENLANPVPAADMVYDHVGRAIIGGWDGDASILPAFKEADVTNSASFVYEVPADEDANNMHVAVFVIDVETGAIANLGAMDVEVYTSVEENNLITGMNIFPNPAQNYSTLSLNLATSVDVRVEIVNAIGAVVAVLPQGELATGAHNIELNTSDLANGIYSLNVFTADKVSSSKISILK